MAIAHRFVELRRKVRVDEAGGIGAEDDELACLIGRLRRVSCAAGRGSQGSWWCGHCAAEKDLSSAGLSCLIVIWPVVNYHMPIRHLGGMPSPPGRGHVLRLDHGHKNFKTLQAIQTTQATAHELTFFVLYRRQPFLQRRSIAFKWFIDAIENGS